MAGSVQGSMQEAQLNGSNTAAVRQACARCNAQGVNDKWPGLPSRTGKRSGTHLRHNLVGCERGLSSGTPFFTASWSSPGSDNHTPGSVPARGFNSYCAQAEADAKKGETPSPFFGLPRPLSD